MPFTMQTVIALVLSVVFIALAILHIAWALGFKWGGEALLPQKPDGALLFNPGVLACFAAAFMFALPALILLVRAGVLFASIPAWMSYVGVWGIATVLFVRAIGDFRYAGLTKRIRGTSFARMDSRVYTPLCLALAALCVILQLV
jgi:hypothetical protein